MEYRKLGRTDMTVSEISLGCWVTGGDYWGGAEDDESVRAIQRAIDQGINFIDTAEIYGRGHSEEVLGKALAGGRRQKVVLASKVWQSNLKAPDVKKACEGSLKRMGTDCIDLYYIHYPSNTGIPIEETMGALDDLQKAGKIRAIGVSNFSVAQMEEALTVHRFDALQPCFSLFWRWEEEAIAFCAKRDIAVAAYSPLAQGLLTGKFTPDWKFPEGDGRARAALFQPGVFEGCLKAVEEIRPIAAKYGKTLGQTALNWTTTQPGMTSAIVGARTAAQAEENAGASGWRLAAEDIAAIERIGRAFTDTLPEFELFFNTNVKK